MDTPTIWRRTPDAQAASAIESGGKVRRALAAAFIGNHGAREMENLIIATAFACPRDAIFLPKNQKIALDQADFLSLS